MNRILIAEDEPGIASFLEKGLRAAGFTTLSVDDGASAAAVARDDTFDLVILDLGLPGLNGHEVLADIRGRGQRMPVVILTARKGVGDTVAIASGSRGIADMATVVAAVAAHLRTLGAAPFVVPAMGSHAGGTAEGQEAMLAELGVSEATCGCPVRSSMDVVELFESKLGFPVYFDRIASQADHVVVCNRVKPHTLYDGPVESGLGKMLLVGLGKQVGAAPCHLAFAEHGFTAVVDDVLPALIERISAAYDRRMGR